MKRLTHAEFVDKMLVINPNIEIISIYKSDRDKVKCRCKLCNYEWEDLATHLKLGRGCGNCKRIKRREENAYNFFLTSSRIHHNKYNYSKFVYVDSLTKGIIICPEHGEFLLIPNSHIKGRGCPKCAGNNYKRTGSEFIQKALEIHGNIYDYSKIDYKTCKDKVLITCNKCGLKFWQTPDGHLLGKGCPSCKLRSQTQIYNKLKQSFPSEEILFEVGSKTIPWLKTLRFDIYFPKYNIAVEYNGELHYIPVEYFGGQLGLELTLKRDSLKKEKCNENQCVLFELKYNYTDEDYNNLVKNILNLICLR